MIEMVFSGIVLLGLLVIGGLLWRLFTQLNSLVQLAQKQQEAQQRTPILYQDLTRQVNELHQAVGSVASSLKAVKHQVDNLNVLADHAIHGISEEFVSDEAEEGPRLLIAIRRPQDDSDDIEHREILTPDDLPPELLEKFKTFKAVYSAIVSNHNYPSRKQPELN